MAPETTKKLAFPVIPAAHWWALRKKFQQSIPGVVTANYLASALNMQENSARANVLPGLRSTKIIDDDGKPTERARRWRDDTQYPEVCAEILKDCYPAELRDAAPDPQQDRSAASRWFANHTGGGEAAVYKMVQFYTLLSVADPNKTTEARASDGPKTERAPRVPKSVRTPAKPSPRASIPTPPALERNKDINHGPAVHINLQVHISADASSEQIDQLFASMAKHIYKKAGE